MLRSSAPADKMTAWKVGKEVGNVKNDSPELIEPASDEGTDENPGPHFS
jgi:putative SOS response-associated peptidase YedK